MQKILRESLCLACCLLLLISTGCRRSSTTSKNVEITTPKTNIKMVLIPGGTFMMGSETGHKDERPKHKVTLTAFAMDKYEVTQKQFADLEVSLPAKFKHPKRPAAMVKWDLAVEYCNERSIKEGLEPCYDAVTLECDFTANGYRLPTEAEWEYAARAGSDSDHGPAGTPEQVKNYACFESNATKKTDIVGRKRPNAWGLHDMTGNVLEWCNDYYSPTYYAASPAKDPRGPDKQKKRVMRGGSWRSKAGECRVSARYAEIPGDTDACFTRVSFGFRCVRKLSAAEMKMLKK